MDVERNLLVQFNPYRGLLSYTVEDLSTAKHLSLKL